jgi:hypothetical protein|tara:strand:- start:400 stop:591 length:192 start_codon:yes stop_codon:yes gene_type:complete
MQHRDIITQKLEAIEGRIARMESLISRGGTVDEYKADLVKSKELIQEVKDYIGREPFTEVEKM